jgi:hypothetical protein
MISENTCVNYERISDIILPSVAEAVFQSFGLDFCDSSLDEKLVLLEALAFTLRDGNSFRENLLAVASGGSPVGLPNIFSTAPLEVNEALKLMAALQAAIVEDYSVKCAKSQPQEAIDDVG